MPKARIKLTANQVIGAIALDPSWALSVEEPVEVTEFINLSNSKITHLSDNLIFTGRDSRGCSANFSNCKSLQVALGHFHGSVDFSSSMIHTVPSDPKLFSSHGKNRNGISAVFKNCRRLLEASGKYPGAVDFSGSGIQRIVDLEIRGSNKPSPTSNQDFCASFYECGDLEVAEGNFSGFVDFTASGVKEINPDTLKITGTNVIGASASFAYCKNLNRATGKFPGFVSFKGSGIKSIGDLHIGGPLKTNYQKGRVLLKLDFRECENLKNIPIGINTEACLLEEHTRKHIVMKAAVLKRAASAPASDLDI
jgi:hypothetical protein